LRVEQENDFNSARNGVQIITIARRIGKGTLISSNSNSASQQRYASSPSRCMHLSTDKNQTERKPQHYHQRISQYSDPKHLVEYVPGASLLSSVETLDGRDYSSDVMLVQSMLLSVKI
jgi:hypothetical protein